MVLVLPLRILTWPRNLLLKTCGGCLRSQCCDFLIQFAISSSTLNCLALLCWFLVYSTALRLRGGLLACCLANYSVSFLAKMRSLLNSITFYCNSLVASGQDLRFSSIQITVAICSCKVAKFSIVSYISYSFYLRVFLGAFPSDGSYSHVSCEVIVFFLLDFFFTVLSPSSVFSPCPLFETDLLPFSSLFFLLKLVLRALLSLDFSLDFLSVFVSFLLGDFSAFDSFVSGDFSGLDSFLSGDFSFLAACLSGVFFPCDFSSELIFFDFSLTSPATFYFLPCSNSTSKPILSYIKISGALLFSYLGSSIGTLVGLSESLLMTGLTTGFSSGF